MPRLSQPNSNAVRPFPTPMYPLTQRTLRLKTNLIANGSLFDNNLNSKQSGLQPQRRVRVSVNVNICDAIVEMV